MNQLQYYYNNHDQQHQSQPKERNDHNITRTPANTTIMSTSAQQLNNVTRTPANSTIMSTQQKYQQQQQQQQQQHYDNTIDFINPMISHMDDSNLTTLQLPVSNSVLNSSPHTRIQNNHNQGYDISDVATTTTSTTGSHSKSVGGFGGGGSDVMIYNMDMNSEGGRSGGSTSNQQQQQQQANMPGSFLPQQQHQIPIQQQRLSNASLSSLPPSPHIAPQFQHQGPLLSNHSNHKQYNSGEHVQYVQLPTSVSNSNSPMHTNQQQQQKQQQQYSSPSKMNQSLPFQPQLQTMTQQLHQSPQHNSPQPLANSMDVTTAQEIDFESILNSPKTKDDIVEKSPGGRYLRFSEKLGSGAYKDVYRAYDTIEGIEVAWNVVNLTGVPRSERQYIVNEVQLLEKLNHSNIISFHGSWVNRELEQVLFVTEILSSGTLKSFITKVQVIRWKIAKRWAKQILKGLEYLHNHDPPIVHRDLKCDNIFINGTSGDLRIGDLGLSTVICKSSNKKVCIGCYVFCFLSFCS